MLSKIHLYNFRNYIDSAFVFDNQTIFCGGNGIGKSNILESIGLISVAKSFRGASDKELVKDGETYYRVVAETTGEDKLKLEIIFQNNLTIGKKTAKAGGVKVSLSKFIGLLKVVAYSFESNEIILGGPGVRRKFLDTLLCQLYPDYTYDLLKIFKVIKNRNQLLFKIKIGRAKEDELDFWDQSLLELSQSITSFRQVAVDFLSSKINPFYNELGASSPIELKYISQSIFEATDIIRLRRQEIEQSATLFGPHRDDLKFLSGGHPVAHHFSRGEIKSLLFALKKGEVAFIKEITGQNPLILLDDIFAELDEARRKNLGRFIDNCQVIMTSTDELEAKKILPQAKIIDLEPV